MKRSKAALRRKIIHGSLLSICQKGDSEAVIPRMRSTRGISAQIQKKIIHASLLSIYQKGVLLLGPSGSGKSECVVDLIKLGHRFIADDAVSIESQRKKIIGRRCTNSYPLCIRGVGIVDVEKLYGPKTTCPQADIDIVVVFKRGRNAGDYELTGEGEKSYSLLGKNIRCLELPVKTHGRMANVVELGVRHLLTCS